MYNYNNCAVDWILNEKANSETYPAMFATQLFTQIKELQLSSCQSLGWSSAEEELLQRAALITLFISTILNQEVFGNKVYSMKC